MKNNVKNNNKVPKAIYGALISAGVGLGTNLIANDKAEKERRKMEARNNKLMMLNKEKQDAQVAENYDVQGQQLNSFYMEKGGMVDKASYQTAGGDLKRKSSNTEEAVGNTHNESTIDGTKGIKLIDNGEVKAEVENDEIIKNGQMVFSDKLKPVGSNKTYADIVDTLTTKKGKLEEKLEKGVNRTTRNTLTRNIEKLEAKENKLFLDQEQQKIDKGIEAPAAEMAVGGTIDPHLLSYDIANTIASSVKPFNDLISSLIPKGKGLVGSTLKKKDIIPMGDTKIKTEKLTPTAPSFNNGKNEASGYEYAGGKFGQNVMPYIDNAVNLINTSTKPKVPKPALTAMPSFKTKVNVSNQLNNVDQAVERTSDFVKSNSSNSNSARANIIAARMRGANSKNQILTNKEQQEQNLGNQAQQSMMQVNSMNNQSLNAHAGQKLGRDLAISKELTQNVSNAIDDYGNLVKYKDSIQLDKEKNQLYRDMFQKNDSAGFRSMYDNASQINLWKNDPEAYKTFVNDNYLDENGNIIVDPSTWSEHQKFMKLNNWN